MTWQSFAPLRGQATPARSHNGGAGCSRDENKRHTMNNPAERVGPAFSVPGMLRARAETRKAIAAIAARIEPGMVEEDAVAMAKAIIVEQGHALTWHPTRVRFGANTMKPMKVPSTPGVVLGANDIFFIDIAPRVDDWEGDGGAAFIVGDAPDYARCAKDAETLFHELRVLWQATGATGQALYDVAARRAGEMGWELDAALPGHRVSDFPHAAIHTGSLADFADTPSSMRWILEIHLTDPQGRFGAFFEDMLLSDEDYASQ